MKRTLLSVLALAGALALSAPAAADPWKDESGHGHRGGPPPWAAAHGERRKHDQRRQHRHQAPAVEVRVPTGAVVIANGRCNREATGAVLGGIVGGILGNQAGRNNGNTEVGTVAGAIIGVVVGKSIGRGMDDRDAGCAVHALNQGRDGQTVVWRNPDSGLDFRLTPTRTFHREGRLCRTYRMEAAGGSGVAKGESEACRMSDGHWAFRRG